GRCSPSAAPCCASPSCSRTSGGGRGGSSPRRVEGGPDMTSKLIVSPHFDDAVLSCGANLLTGGPPATVLTVCGGAPAPGTPPSSWDWRCGFLDGHSAAVRRRQEDERACAAAGA